MNKDLTQGEPRSVLWRFSLPLFISVIFQQMYNMADSIIAGKFAGEAALSAVGVSYPITMIFMAIAIGSNIGASVVISQLFGARNYRRMKTAVYTVFISSIVLSALLTVIGLIISEPLMRLIQTPADIFNDSALYLQIYIGGFIFLFIYNICTGVFQSLGDSKTPLYFLIGSSIGNIILDLVFVAVFHWDVAGVAWATFIAQGAACILAVISLLKRLKAVETKGRIVKFSFSMLKKITAIAVPSILQQSFVSVGNIFIQGAVNSFGSSVIAGYSAAVKLNTFAITSFTTLGNGLSSFTAQNHGALKPERIRQGFRAGVIMAIAVAALFFITMFFASGAVVRLFMNEGSEMAMDTAKEFLRIVSPFYFVVTIKLMADGVLRGIGAMGQFMTSTFTDLLLRVVLCFVLCIPFGETGIWLSWPIGWVVSTALSVIFYLHSMRRFKTA